MCSLMLCPYLLLYSSQSSLALPAQVQVLAQALYPVASIKVNERNNMLEQIWCACTHAVSLFNANNLCNVFPCDEQLQQIILFFSSYPCLHALLFTNTVANFVHRKVVAVPATTHTGNHWSDAGGVFQNAPLPPSTCTQTLKNLLSINM